MPPPEAYLRFAASRNERCDELERRLARARSRPREVGYRELEGLAFQYRQLLHDHALAQARFAGTAVARRLHQLALEATHWLQQDPGEHLPRPGRFLRATFPRAFRRILPVIGFAASLFGLGALFGLCLATVEPSVGLLFLSPKAVADLAEGELWTAALFSVVPGSVASSAIATNNLSVAMTAWAGGALAGALGVYVVFFNGLMLGVLLAVTMHYSMAGPLLAFIAAHGPLEITLILVSAAAGIDVGRALVVASDRPRAELLRETGRNALVVLLGCLPWIALAAYVEGFLSPSPGYPTAFKVAVGLLLELLFLTLAWGRPASAGTTA